MTLTAVLRARLAEAANAARRTLGRVAARLERARSADADPSSPEPRMAQWLCRACGTTYDSRRDDCWVCGSRMVERIPERSAGAVTDLVESPGDRSGR